MRELPASAPPSAELQAHLTLRAAPSSLPPGQWLAGSALCPRPPVLSQPGVAPEPASPSSDSQNRGCSAGPTTAHSTAPIQTARAGGPEGVSTSSVHEGNPGGHGASSPRSAGSPGWQGLHGSGSEQQKRDKLRVPCAPPRSFPALPVPEPRACKGSCGLHCLRRVRAAALRCSVTCRP